MGGRWVLHLHIGGAKFSWVAAVLYSLSSTRILSLGVFMSRIMRRYTYKLGIETGSLIQKQQVSHWCRGLIFPTGSELDVGIISSSAQYHRTRTKSNYYLGIWVFVLVGHHNMQPLPKSGLYYTVIHPPCICPLPIIYLAQPTSNMHLRHSWSFLEVDSLAVSCHCRLLERLSERRVRVTCPGDILARRTVLKC